MQVAMFSQNTTHGELSASVTASLILQSHFLKDVTLGFENSLTSLMT